MNESRQSFSKIHVINFPINLSEHIVVEVRSKCIVTLYKIA